MRSISPTEFTLAEVVLRLKNDSILADNFLENGDLIVGNYGFTSQDYIGRCVECGKICISPDGGRWENVNKIFYCKDC